MKDVKKLKKQQFSANGNMLGALKKNSHGENAAGVVVCVEA